MKHISLSWKIMLLLAFFFVVPILGWYLSHYFESKLERAAVAENQQQLEIYHGFFQKLLEEDADFAQSLALKKQPNQVTVSKRQGSILVDGFADEWFPYQNAALSARNNDTASQLMLVEDERLLFGLLQISDNQLIYRASPYSSQSSDMVRLDLGQGFWLFQAIAPGRMQVLREYGDGFQTLNSVYAVWQETQTGYNIEFRVPKALVGDRINAVLYDVDDKELANYNKNYQGVFTFTNFNYFPLSRETNNDWLLDNQLNHQRLIILNTNGQVIYRLGQLFSQEDEFYTESAKIEQLDSYSNIPKIDDQFTQNLNDQDVSVETAGNNSMYFISRAAKPFVLNEAKYGAIILESSLLDKKLSLQQIRWMALLGYLLVWFLISFLILKQIKNYRSRVGILTELTEEAYENDADTVDLKKVSIDGNDEVSQVFENLNYFNERLEQRRDHQKKLLARLNHELRTPLAIIGSSIDNLALSDLTPEDQPLIANARAGLERLSLSFSRLSEANRLEESVDSVQLQWFELIPLLESLTESYSNTWPKVKFLFNNNAKAIKIKGSEDLFAQMMDKLVSNAVDFSEPDTPVVIQLDLVKSSLQLSITNKGPTIDNAKLKTIFNIMESHRNAEQKLASSNLGLGLYIAKLIARRHKARISAKNLESNDGVALKLDWHKKNYVVL
ncbi:MAG: hypothetical protein HWE16_05705 [Gammaproteobacteria bacterium]|nr:hypothetical protein [Gammaproteobacteria bacterium]